MLKNRIGWLRRLNRILCAALAVLTASAVLLLGGCSSDPKPQTATADESSPTAAPTVPTPTVAEEMLHGEPASAEQFIGSWVSYPFGKQITYTYDDDGCAVFLNEDGVRSEYQYVIEGDRIIQTRGEKKKIYIWSQRAITFIADHQHGEASNLTALIRERIPEFAGYMFAQGDYLYIGQICMCRKEKLEGSDDASIVGSWTGAEGDFVTFSADGSYHYREMGIDYDGSYVISEDGGSLTLILPGTNDIVLNSAQWEITGRVLRLSKKYYFFDTE